MKLMLACAFSYDAKILILNEPTSGLDPVSRDELLNILSEYIEDGEYSVLFLLISLGIWNDFSTGFEALIKTEDLK